MKDDKKISTNVKGGEASYNPPPKTDDAYKSYNPPPSKPIVPKTPPPSPPPKKSPEK